MADNKMTAEELERKKQEALEVPDTLDTLAPEDEDIPGDEPTEEDEAVTPDEEETPENESEEDEDIDNTPDPKTPTPEERYKESTREAQVLYSKQKKFTETVEKAAQLPEPTPEELQAEYSDWDVMTETEQRFAKENLMNKRRFEMIHEATLEGKKLDEWVEKVDSFLVQGVTKHPRLVGKEEKFKAFCMKPTRRGVDLDDLVGAFLFGMADNQPARKKGSLLATGSGGRSSAPQQEFMDEKQAAVLRTKNHKLYQRMVREGKIKINI